ncbi:MAG: hypothetical protein B7Y77_01845 [Bradyrhizobium sp. 35-63-5]|nr:MAG: hypothetical protein B7Y77_01845 [Bradyrhizobium sp. 35-63-5]
MGIRVGGVAYVKVDGNNIPARGNFVIHPNQIERTGVAGQDGVQGYTEMPRVPAIEGDVTTEPGVSIMDMLNVTDATVQIECANGMVYVLRNAWQAGLADLNTVEGSAKFRWEGLSMDEFAGSTVA